MTVVQQSGRSAARAELDVYPPVVPHLVTFYFEHPELRYELGTEKSLERIRTGDFVA